MGQTCSLGLSPCLNLLRKKAAWKPRHSSGGNPFHLAGQHSFADHHESNVGCADYHSHEQRPDCAESHQARVCLIALRTGSRHKVYWEGGENALVREWDQTINRAEIRSLVFFDHRAGSKK